MWNFAPEVYYIVSAWKALKPKCAGVFSVSIGLLNKSHVIEPHTCKVLQTTTSSCKWRASSTSEITHRSKLFPSDNDDSVVLPDQPYLAPPKDFVIPTLRISHAPHLPSYISTPWFISSDSFPPSPRAFNFPPSTHLTQYILSRAAEECL